MYLFTIIRTSRRLKTSIPKNWFAASQPAEILNNVSRYYSMDRPALYRKNNDLPKRGTEYFLENYLHLVNWKEEGNVLDIGSGDGFVLTNLLVPQLPKNYGKVIGIDISEEMVNFAQETCQNERLRFVKMDIGTKYIPEEFLGEFQHVFSFFAFHWVPDQRQGLKNIYKMLKPGGDLLIQVLTFNPVFDSYETMAATTKWAPHTKDWRSSVSPYNHSQNPAEEFERLLQSEGFVDITCKEETLSYTFPEFDQFQNSYLAVNPFIGKLPRSMVDEYIQDLAKTMKKMRNITLEKTNNGKTEGRLHINYGILIVNAKKPEDISIL